MPSSGVGFGSVEPGMAWAATAQVGDAIGYLHPNLKTGAIVDDLGLATLGGQ